MGDEFAKIPPDDLSRKLVVVRPETDESLLHVGIAGDTYTVLLTGMETAGRYCLIDMMVPPGGGPPPHRHDFEEMFSVLEGEVEVTFRGETAVLRAGETANVPANAPHQFRNVSGKVARMLCLCSPAGMEEFFASIGIPVATRTTPCPEMNEAGKAAFMGLAMHLAPRFRTEFVGAVPPDPGIRYTEKVRMRDGDAILVMVKDGKVLHYSWNMSLPHVEFVKRATGTRPEGAWVGTVSKLEGEVMGISSKYFFDYQLPAPEEVNAAIREVFE